MFSPKAQVPNTQFTRICIISWSQFYVLRIVTAWKTLLFKLTMCWRMAKAFVCLLFLWFFSSFFSAQRMKCAKTKRAKKHNSRIQAYLVSCHAPSLLKYGLFVNNNYIWHFGLFGFPVWLGLCVRVFVCVLELRMFWLKYLMCTRPKYCAGGHENLFSAYSRNEQNNLICEQQTGAAAIDSCACTSFDLTKI